MLDVEFFGDKGVGLGPTKEFITLVSHEFQKASLQMFIKGENVIFDRNSNEELIFNKAGLFPKPIMYQEGRNLTELACRFYCLGQLTAKSLLDEKYLDLRFSRPFLKLVLNEPIEGKDLLELFPVFGEMITQFEIICENKNNILSDPLKTDEEKDAEIANLTYKGSLIADLDLTFTIPGEGLLVENGDQIDLTIWNLEEYIEHVYNSFFGDGVKPLVRAFRKGFSTFFSIDSLRCFTIDELESVICGVFGSQYWKKSEFLAFPFELANGYHEKSSCIWMLIELFSEFTVEEQRKFLIFLTGSPRLPPGGFKNLSPLIKISRKEVDSDPNLEFPSANTCFHHFKMPEYSSVEKMKAKILYAIENSAKSFDLT